MDGFAIDEFARGDSARSEFRDGKGEWGANSAGLRD